MQRNTSTVYLPTCLKKNNAVNRDPSARQMDILLKIKEVWNGFIPGLFCVLYTFLGKLEKWRRPCSISAKGLFTVVIRLPVQMDFFIHL